jgi:hypothetical protein
MDDRFKSCFRYGFVHLLVLILANHYDWGGVEQFPDAAFPIKVRRIFLSRPF